MDLVSVLLCVVSFLMKSHCDPNTDLYHTLYSDQGVGGAKVHVVC